jgi:hypothetical protein
MIAGINDSKSTRYYDGTASGLGIGIPVSYDTARIGSHTPGCIELGLRDIDR